MKVIPLTLKEANSLVSELHRHHKPVQGHRFSLGLIDETGKIVGAAICGRPVARLAGSPSEVLEVTRLVTDGTYNACSIRHCRPDPEIQPRPPANRQHRCYPGWPST